MLMTTRRVPTEFRLSAARGFDRKIGVSRLDASRILFFDGKYHLWYTRFENRNTLDEIIFTPGLSSIWLAVSDDGRHWTELCDVMEHPGMGHWPACFRHAPYVVFDSGKYYMFFTSQVGKEYLDKRVSLAVADRPEGPFRYQGDGPLLPAVGDVFDFVGQDDACVIHRDGRYLFYFKGYSYDKERDVAVNNQLCLSVADRIYGPYTRIDDNPVARSHTGCVWPQAGGVALISDAGPVSVEYGDDGKHFPDHNDVKVAVDDPDLPASVEASLDLWHVEISDPGVFWEGDGISWGISQLPDVENAPKDGLPPHWYPFFVRFDIDGA